MRSVLSLRCFPVLFALFVSLQDDAHAQDTSICDNPSGDCNVRVFDFQNKDFDDVKSTYGDNTVVDGVSYDMAFEVRLEERASLYYTFEVFPSSRYNPFDCSKSVIWIDGYTAPMSDVFIRGRRDDEPYCYFEISEKFPRDVLAAPKKIFFLFKELVSGSGQRVYIKRDYSYNVLPEEDVIFYLYNLDNTDVVAEATGTGQEVTLDIAALSYDTPDWDGIGWCNPMDERMRAVVIGRCSIPLKRGSEAEGGSFVYDLLKQQYESCATSIETSWWTVTYGFDIELPTQIESCYYFRPGNNQQSFTVEIDARDREAGGSASARQVSVDIAEYAIERCSPLDGYIIPQAKPIVVAQYTFEGDSMELVGTPFLDDAINTMSEESRTCWVFDSGTRCNVTFKADTCQEIYNTDDDRCVFDRHGKNVLQNVGFKETDTQVNEVFTHVINDIQTDLEFRAFSQEACAVEGNFELIDVSDDYTPEILMRNLPTPDFSSEPNVIEFFNELIIRIRLTDSADLTVHQLQINSVTFQLIDPSDGEVINVFTFNKADKLDLMHADFTPFYDDGHFCSYHYNENNTCPIFYDPTVGRTNPYVDAEIMPRISDVCQLSGDTSVTDFFTFLPMKWFTGITIPTVDVGISVVSTLQVCDGSSGNHTYSRRLQEEGEKQTIQYMMLSDTAQFVTDFYLPDATPAPTGTTTGGGNVEAAIADLAPWMMTVIAMGTVILTGACCWIWVYFDLRRRIFGRAKASVGTSSFFGSGGGSTVAAPF